MFGLWSHSLHISSAHSPVLAMRFNWHSSAQLQFINPQLTDGFTRNSPDRLGMFVKKHCYISGEELLNFTSQYLQEGVWLAFKENLSPAWPRWKECYGATVHVFLCRTWSNNESKPTPVVSAPKGRSVLP